MTNPTPKQNTQPQQPAQKPAAGNAAPNAKQNLTPEERLKRIISAPAKPKADAGDDILADGKKKPPAKAPQKKSPPAKQATQPKKAPKEAPKGQSDDADDILGDATGEDDDADLTEGKNANPDDTQDDADPDEDGDTAEGDDEEGDGSEVNDEAEDDGTLYKVKVAGKELEVTLPELLKGYSRTADYQQKTAAVAKERKEVEAIKESVKDLPQQREGYMKGAERFALVATVMNQALQQKFMPKPPAPELAQTDPAAYFAQKTACEEAVQFTGALQKELENTQARLVADAKVNHAKAVKESRVKLYEAMPDMAQPVARQKLREYANSLGFTDEQIATESNHVLFVCVEKARRWDDLQAQKANAKPKAPVQKVVRRTQAAETKRAVNQREKQNAFMEHKQKGTIKSAERAFQRLFST